MWHQGPVSRKTIFPQTGNGWRTGNTSEASLTHLPTTHHLLCGPVPNRPGLIPVHGPGVGDPCSRIHCKFYSVDTIFYLNQLSHTNPNFPLLLKHQKTRSPHPHGATTGGAESTCFAPGHAFSSRGHIPPNQSPPHHLHFLLPSPSCVLLFQIFPVPTVQAYLPYKPGEAGSVLTD